MDGNAFDLFQGLAALGGKDYEWYDKLSPEGQKAAAPFVMMRWMCGTSDESQIIRINTHVNPYVFSPSMNKSALFKSLAAAATGRNKRYSWIKGPTTKSRKLSTEVTMAYYECSPRECADYKIDAQSLIEMAEELGWDKEQIAKLKKECDNDGPTGDAAKQSAKPKKPVGRGKSTAGK